MEPAAPIFTDEATVYAGMPNHEAVRHSVGEFVRNQAHTNGLESFWAGLKRGFEGVYHQMSPKHLNRYVNEFSGRHNIRPLDTEEQMSAIARGGVGKRLPYAAHRSAPHAHPALEPRRPQGCARELQGEPAHDEPEAPSPVFDPAFQPLDSFLPWASSDK